ncbi:Bifunctional transcriptional activator/DNA repair enzyme Ada [Pseudomonas aeruginosa]|nr:Bifunctional transcriptional activator/DNA repair enzyme Ada [Pseudomonas aeruginosa]
MSQQLDPCNAYHTDEQRWAAVLARDAAADGAFVYAVKTTGVYCRPSSSARRPRRENVEFFATAEAAEAAGYRPSRRAAGDRSLAAEQRAERVAQACRMIETAETPPALEALAARLGMSPFHFHRLFKADSVEKVASAASGLSSVPAVEVAASHFKLPSGVSLSVLAQV